MLQYYIDIPTTGAAAPKSSKENIGINYYDKPPILILWMFLSMVVPDRVPRMQLYNPESSIWAPLMTSS